MVRARVPRRHLERVVLGGGLVAPVEAERLGLVDEIQEDPLACARVRLDALAASPPAAYARTKRDLRGAAPRDLASDEATDTWMRESLGTWTSSELKLKIAAALRR
jgi:enoyl-CoA hydratase/carnithine racemase